MISQKDLLTYGISHENCIHNSKFLVTYVCKQIRYIYMIEHLSFPLFDKVKRIVVLTNGSMKIV